MTTTITLTPTLTLSVGDRRMPQQRVDDVWSAIAQHTRATDRPATIAVVDGSETLRVWELRPDGSRTLLDSAPPEPVDFRLLLSPWTMTVPLDDGPDDREVSTLAVALSQAEAAARAGNVEIILQTIGTDHDDAKSIDPTPTEDIVAQRDADEDAEEPDDLMDDLVDEDENAAQATRKKRRRLVLASSAAAVLVLAGLGLGANARLSNDDPQPSTAPESQEPTESAAATEEPSSPAPIQNQAISPAGFSDTSTWKVVGATDQSTGMTSDGEHIGAVSGRTLDIVRTDDGDPTDSVTLPAALDGNLYSLEDGGLLLPAEGRVMTWSKEHGLVDNEVGKDDRLVVRGSTAFTVPQRDDVRPDEIQVVTADGFQTHKSPGSSASPIAPAHNAGFLWASSAEGGSLVHADTEGEELSSTRLIGPSDDARISQWLGATDDFAAVIWSDDGSGGVLAIHDAETGKIVETHDLPSVGNSMSVVPSVDGKQLLAGTTPINLSTAKIGSPVSDLSTSNRAIVAVPGGWIAQQTDGTSVLISPDGQTLPAPSTAEDLLGLTDSGDIVVDHRGTLAAFAPDSETEGDDQ